MLWELLPVQKPVCLSRATYSRCFAASSTGEFFIFISENRPKEGSPDRPAWDAVGCGGTPWDAVGRVGRGLVGRVATGGVLGNGHVTVGSGQSHTSCVR